MSKVQKVLSFLGSILTVIGILLFILIFTGIIEWYNWFYFIISGLSGVFSFAIAERIHSDIKWAKADIHLKQEWDEKKERERKDAYKFRWWADAVILEVTIIAVLMILILWKING